MTQPTHNLFRNQSSSRNRWLRRYAQILRDAITERAIEVEAELLAKDPRYQELNVKICELLDKIERNLPPEMQRLVFELDDVMMEQGALEIRTMYLQGLYDRFNVERFWMRVLGIWGRKSRKQEIEKNGSR